MELLCKWIWWIRSDEEFMDIMHCSGGCSLSLLKMIRGRLLVFGQSRTSKKFPQSFLLLFAKWLNAMVKREVIPLYSSSPDIYPFTLRSELSTTFPVKFTATSPHFKCQINSAFICVWQAPLIRLVFKWQYSETIHAFFVVYMMCQSLY